MLKFLLQRPIAVLMAFTACFIVGLVTYYTLPVSLLPDIAIPEITVQVSGKTSSARELENTVVKPIRQQLMQVSRLKDIHSETRDGAGTIYLSFDYGVNINLAFIEVNEKIDAAMGNLPREVERPRVIKASATDIPVLYLNLTLHDSIADNQQSLDTTRFLDLCEFAESVIKRQIEQLPEVAMVDVTGSINRQLQIVPDMRLLGMANITLSDLESALSSNNIEPGSTTVRDGYYEYNVKFSSLLRTVDDVENIYIRKDDHIFQLKDLAKVRIVPIKESGISLSNGKRAVTLAIIKQADEKMDNMKTALRKVTDYFASIYPDVEFHISRNQTELLDYTISNLKQDLSLGFLFICIVAILFLGDVKSPAVIGLSMTVSLVISFLFFYLFKISINIISLSGLILALGMMIDSAIIVTENITQYRARGYSLKESCEKGTTEVITPMLSSTFTTIAVFVPLVFMSGIAGAIFYDQAFAVTVGLIVSYFTGIMLLPVLYKMVYSIPEVKKGWLNIKINNPIKAHTLDKFYDAGVNFTFRHKLGTIIFILVTLPVCVFMFSQIPKSKMPEIDQVELLSFIEWNENIHIDENQKRVSELFNYLHASVAEYSAYVGQQQFLLNREQELSVSEAELYFKTASTSEIGLLQKKITEWLQHNYPGAVFSFAPPETVFEKLFVTGQADVVAKFYSHNKAEAPVPATIDKIESTLKKETGSRSVGVVFENQLNISIDRQKLLLYNVDYNDVYRVLKTAFKDNEVATLRSYQQYLPISIANNEQSINEILHNTLIPLKSDDNMSKTSYIPLLSLVKVTPGEDFKTITAGKDGEYIPFSFYDVKEPEQLMQQVNKAVKQTAFTQSGHEKWNVDFAGNFFSNQKMLNELVIILFVSVLMVYFILTAQFESFLQPLIVLLELPIDVAGALLVLWLCGNSLNLMSGIGIVVTCGIVINDSILKLDAINELRKTGIPLFEAIHEAGRRRLRPIIMTALTSILAMVPLLFSFDMGSELQKPLSIAMISTMLVGTPVSLFIIPLVYWFIYRKPVQN